LKGPICRQGGEEKGRRKGQREVKGEDGEGLGKEGGTGGKCEA